MQTKISLKREEGLRGEISVPADKSILHRAILFNAVANGTALVRAASFGRDNLASIRVMRQLGVDIKLSLGAEMLKLAQAEGISDAKLSSDNEASVEIKGGGFSGLKPSTAPLYCGNSGTTARLLTGILAGRPFKSTLSGDESLTRRPFRRVVEPLTLMGASFSGDKLPFTISAGALRGIDYDSPVASAQVKSAILLAGLQASGDVSISEPFCSRDHTERLLRAQGVDLETSELETGKHVVKLRHSSSCCGETDGFKLKSIDIDVCGDFSHAAFILVAAILIDKSDVLVRNVGFNPTRLGLWSILTRMGGKLEATNHRIVGGEEVVDLRVSRSELSCTEVKGEEVVRAIDEIPILSVAASFSNGVTRIRGAEELRVKESDRLKMIATMLMSFGVEVEEFQDGLDICGKPELANMWQRVVEARVEKNQVESWKKCGDHRILMAGAVMELIIRGEFFLPDMDVVETSFPTFNECFQLLSGGD